MVPAPRSCPSWSWAAFRATCSLRPAGQRVPLGLPRLPTGVTLSPVGLGQCLETVLVVMSGDKCTGVQ